MSVDDENATHVFIYDSVFEYVCRIKPQSGAS